MPRILLVAKMAKNGRRRQDAHPKESVFSTAPKHAEAKKQQMVGQKSRQRERTIKYADDAPSHAVASTPSFETYLLHLRSHVMELRHAEFTARLR